MNSRRTFSSPAAVHRSKDSGVGFHKKSLLVRPEQENSISLPESREDLASDTEIWMIHVATLGGPGKAEGDSAIVFWRHFAPRRSRLYLRLKTGTYGLS